MVIGGKGTGKSTLGTWFAQFSHQNWPQIPIVTNMTISNTIRYEDVLKFLAMKIIAHDRRRIVSIVDEAALAGLEARKSGSSYVDSYLVALARKAPSDLFLLSQMMSMIDKRGQWLGDIYILCEAHYETRTDMPDYFLYKTFDTNLLPVQEYELNGLAAARYLFPRFLTEEIPFEQRLIDLFIEEYDIDKADLGEYKDIMDDFYERGVTATIHAQA